MAGPIFLAADKLLLACRIDDPVNAVPVNGVGGWLVGGIYGDFVLGGAIRTELGPNISFLSTLGILGLICAPLLRADGKGLFYVWSLESLELFGWNMVGMVSIILWTGSTTGLIFWLLKRSNPAPGFNSFSFIVILDTTC